MDVDSIGVLKEAFAATGDNRLQASAEALLFGRRNALNVERSALEVVGGVVGVRETECVEARAYIRRIDREIQKVDDAICEVKAWETSHS